MTGEQLIPASQQDTWKALNDPEVLKACVPGCESITRVNDNEYQVQMTARVRGLADGRGPSTAASGRQYLEARRRASRPDLPSAVDAFLVTVRPLVVQERREPAAAGLLATIYHLVHRDDLPAYERKVKTMAPENVIVSGPWPPFAFAPRLI